MQGLLKLHQYSKIVCKSNYTTRLIFTYEKLLRTHGRHKMNILCANHFYYLTKIGFGISNKYLIPSNIYHHICL